MGVMSAVKRIGVGAGALVLAGGGFAAGVTYANWGDPVITAHGIEQQISTSSELTTVKVTHTGLIRYEEGSIPLINKKTFNMIYSANIRVGVDLTDVDVTVEGKQITVEIPKATVQQIAIDPSSIVMYDKSFTLISGSSEEDVTAAIAEAEADISKNLDDETLMATADQQAEDVIEGLLQPLTTGSQGYTIQFVHDDGPVTQ
ncbi:DUF4230 domain-containing protein [Actinomyces bowdenii]|uniref:DUF4230 domain-containing protein n=1 Tax=Actinomyces bowdenii TaxID=131109 RepID=A0A853EL15_9ACTO|nr:DUF4230 domain-containing protein [Actinomyces bowdenii]MBF0696719.1 DUF4230 domain-containing protein [Actinomyces bowdenii]NYS68892.1 DUF4230 domain-containing protein [Actinomyces bowdenii]